MMTFLPLAELQDHRASFYCARDAVNETAVELNRIHMRLINGPENKDLERERVAAQRSFDLALELAAYSYRSAQQYMAMILI